MPLPVMGTHYARALTDERQSGERKRDPVRCKLYDARGSAARSGVPSTHVMSEVIYLRQKEKPPPFSYLLSDQEPSLQINTVFGNVLPGSCLSYQLQDFGRPKTNFVVNFEMKEREEIRALKCTEFPDIPMITSGMLTPFIVNDIIINNNTHSSAKQFIVENLIVDLKEAQALEKRTVLQGQGECTAEWISEHQHRITASNFGKILFRKQTPSESMLKNIFISKDLSNVKAIAHGKAKEKVARTIYAKQMQKGTKFPGI